MMNNIKISIKKIIILCVSLLIGCNLCNIVSYAVTPTTYTMTPTAEGDGFAITQSAYQVSNIYSELGLNNAEDMVVYGDTAYIADSGNHRVVILDLLTGKYNTIGEDILNNPTGVAVDKEGRIYVADYIACIAGLLWPWGKPGPLRPLHPDDPGHDGGAVPFRQLCDHLPVL